MSRWFGSFIKGSQSSCLTKVMSYCMDLCKLLIFVQAFKSFLNANIINILHARYCLCCLIMVIICNVHYKLYISLDYNTAGRVFLYGVQNLRSGDGIRQFTWVLFYVKKRSKTNTCRRIKRLEACSIFA